MKWGSVGAGASLLPFLLGQAVPAQEAIDRGKELFTRNCLACHGKAGAGDGPAGKALNPRPANLRERAPQLSDEELAKVIKRGGLAVGKSPIMAPFGAKLTDEEIAEVVAYIRVLSRGE